MKEFKFVRRFFKDNTNEVAEEKTDISVESDEMALRVSKKLCKEEEAKGNPWICYVLLSARDLSPVAHKVRFTAL